jgi:copper oxidase (laccase) domain-containing protein
VGPEVLEQLGAFRARTRRGTAGVDLPAAAAADLDGVEVWQSGVCTCCGIGFHSYRRDGGRERQVAVAWRD